MRNEKPPIPILPTGNNPDPDYFKNLVKKDECPVCLHEVDCASLGRGTERKPSPGDFSICVYCTAYLRFDEKMNLYCPSEDEVIDCDMLDMLQRMKKTVGSFKAQFPEMFGPKQ